MIGSQAPSPKSLQVLLRILYGLSSVFECFQEQKGLDCQNLARGNPYMTRYFNRDEEYFSDYGPRVTVIVTETLAYCDRDAR